MAVKSGRNGAVNGVPRIFDWQVDYKADTQPVVDSGTSGATTRLPGNKDWSGSINGNGYQPPLMPGADLAFVGSEDGENGLTGNAIIDQIAVNINIESKESIAYAMNFSGNGLLTPGAAVAVDDSISVGFSPGSSKIEICTPAASPTWTEVPNIKTIGLTITAANQEHADSSTNGTKGRIKGNCDFTVTYSRNCNGFADLIEPNSVRGLRIYVTDTLYWELLWVMFGDATGLKVDRKTGAILGYTQNAAMCATCEIGGTPTKGHILLPDAAHTQWWPEAA